MARHVVILRKDCLAVALIPVCAEVFLEDGGEGQREMREREKAALWI